MSSSVKPLTVSENRIVTSNSPCAGKSSQLSIVTDGDVGAVGAVVAVVAVVVFTRKLLLSATLLLVSSSPSTATPAGTVTVTLPWNSSLGVTSTV